MEAACKQVVNQRLKGTGMRWGEPGADAVCHLRALFRSEKRASGKPARPHSTWPLNRGFNSATPCRPGTYGHSRMPTWSNFASTKARLTQPRGVSRTSGEASIWWPGMLNCSRKNRSRNYPANGGCRRSPARRSAFRKSIRSPISCTCQVLQPPNRDLPVPKEDTLADLMYQPEGHEKHGRSAVPKEDTLADLMYLPLPTINSAMGRVESIRRVVIAASTQFADRIEWIRRRLPGQDLIEENEKQTVGLLNILPTSDWVLRQQRGRRCRR